jgi:hypothetical protein
MRLGIPRACDVNVSLQQRMKDDMDTCAFTSRGLDDHAAAASASTVPSFADQTGAPTCPPATPPTRSPSHEEHTQRQRFPEPPAQQVDAFPPTWAVVLALAVALAAVAYFNNRP